LEKKLNEDQLNTLEKAGYKNTFINVHGEMRVKNGEIRLYQVDRNCIARRVKIKYPSVTSAQMQSDDAS
jgi:hypothetical protein